MHSINCKGKLIHFDTPRIMGIINVTPDSFYNSNGMIRADDLTALARKMVDEGADIIDIGGQSTRPGSKRISAEEEIGRVVPIIELIHRAFPDVPISVDTYQATVAREAIHCGASLVNDISGGLMDPAMLDTVASLRVPYICMHMQGSPETMQENPQYDDVVLTVLDFFTGRIQACTKAGINDIILDPGFGFGKTITHNFQLLDQLGVFSITGRPILAGLSRKSTIYRTLGVSANEALNGTTVLNTIALMNGASLLRVHDVKEAKETVSLFDACKKASRGGRDAE